MLAFLLQVGLALVMLWLFLGFLGWVALVIEKSEPLGWRSLASVVLALPVALVGGLFTLLVAVEDARR